MKKSRQAFTIVELLVFTAIFALVMISFVTILVSVTRVQSRQLASGEVDAQSRFLLQQVQYYVQVSSLVEADQDVPSSTLKLRMAPSSTDPTVISLSGGQVFLQQGTDAPVALTSQRVKVSNLTFTKRSNPGAHDSVDVAFTLAANGGAFQTFAELFQTSIARVSAATFDSSIIPSSTGLVIGNAANFWTSMNATLYFAGTNPAGGTNVGIAQSAPTQALEVNGGVKLNTSTARPACGSATTTALGTFWYTQGASNASDTIAICAKNSSNVYGWVNIVSLP